MKGEEPKSNYVQTMCKQIPKADTEKTQNGTTMKVMWLPVILCSKSMCFELYDLLVPLPHPSFKFFAFRPPFSILSLVQIVW